jgi:hypothetical protein
MHFGSYLNNSCGSYADGETEDYSVKITGGVCRIADAERFEDK